MRGFAYIAVVSGLLASACTPTTWYEKEIATIDSLIYSIDTCTASLGKLDTLDYTTLSKTFSERTNFVQAWHTQRGDTMQREVAMIMSEYRELKKPLQNFTKEYYRVEAELVFTKNQLGSLRHDLSNNLLDTNIVKRVFIEEKLAAEKIMYDKQALETSNMVSKRKLVVIEPKMDSLITALKTL